MKTCRIDRLEQSFVAAETGQYGWGRVAGGHSTALGDGTLTLVGETKRYDGPWDQDEGLQHGSVWGKYLLDTSIGQTSFTLSGYEGNWHPTEQIRNEVQDLQQIFKIVQEIKSSGAPI